MKKTIKEALKEYAKSQSVEVNDKGYYNSYKDNIFNNEMDDEFQKMFDDGNGGELHSKAEALHSSSMLAYNFFHVIKENNITFKEVTYYDVKFEVKLKTLNARGGYANMDAVLIGKDKSEKPYVLFIESKFLEYTENKSFELSDSYNNPTNRLNHKNDDFLSGLIDAVPKNQKGYLEGLKQIITHLFGIQGFLNGEKCEALKDIDIPNTNFEFATMVFEPEQGFEESPKYESYRALFKEFNNKIRKMPNLKGPQWISYSEWWEKVKGQYPKDLQEYLQEKYMNLAK